MLRLRIFGLRRPAGWAGPFLACTPVSLHRRIPMSTTSSPPSPTFTSSPTSGSTGGSGKDTPTSATLLFGLLIIFATLFMAFLCLGFFWRLRHRRRSAVLFESDDEVRRTYSTHRRVPKLCEVWTQDEAGRNQWDWESIRVSCAIPVPHTTPSSALLKSLVSER